MQLRRKILQILADCRIIIGGENQFSNEEFSGFRRIGNAVKTQNEAIGTWSDVCNTISQARLLCDIIFGDAAVIILQEKLLDLNGSNPRSLLGSQALARLQFGAAVLVQIVGIEIVIGLEIVNIAEAVLLVHKGVDHDQVRSIFELYHLLNIFGREVSSHERTNVRVAGQHSDDRVPVAKVLRARNILRTTIEELFVELFFRRVLAERDRK